MHGSLQLHEVLSNCLWSLIPCLLFFPKFIQTLTYSLIYSLFFIYPHVYHNSVWTEYWYQVWTWHLLLPNVVNQRNKALVLSKDFKRHGKIPPALPILWHPLASMPLVAIDSANWILWWKHVVWPAFKSQIELNLRKLNQIQQRHNNVHTHEQEIHISLYRLPEFEAFWYTATLQQHWPIHELQTPFFTFNSIFHSYQT